MQGFDPFFHKFILFEFKLDFYPLNMLKRLLEGREYAYPVKCSSDSVFKFNGPIMFVSNDALDTSDEAFKNRLFVIEACNAYWENYEVPRAVWPIKEEPFLGSEAPEFPVWELLEEETSDSAEEVLP